MGNLDQHPCFSHRAHFRWGRIHLPVAPACNIQCAFCDRKYDCPNESRPGVTSRVLTPGEALERTAQAIQAEPRILTVGIAGPGEPLANPQTLETFRLVKEAFPQLNLCVSTNGLCLPEQVKALKEVGVGTLTVTINSLTPAVGARIYEFVTDPVSGQRLRGEEGAALLQKCQQEGLRLAVEAGMTVKINSVLIPGVNDGEIPGIAAIGRRAGAYIMNVMPLIPCGRMHSYAAPSAEQVQAVRHAAGEYLPQFLLCKQCRADACGIPGL